MKASIILKFLEDLHNKWIDLNKINVNIKDINGDIFPAKSIEEDLYDKQTNNILTDIIIKVKLRD